MRQVYLCILFGSGALLHSCVHAANYAREIVAYEPGHNPGALTNAPAALGEPARLTDDPLWGIYPVDPFSPPYLDSQLVALGDGGSLSVRFDHPVIDDPENPFGLDFLVFGNAFFQLNNDGTTTTGFLAGTNAGITTISVSPDGAAYYTLAPEWAANPDGWFPTDHAGNPTRPVDPALTAADFAGQDLAGIRRLYDGSSGGTGYDLAWARDGQGNPVQLQFARYIRFDQADGAAQIDAMSAVSPAPTIYTDFATDPAAEGWFTIGDASLFHWDAGNGNLRVQWDSSRTNSYYLHALGRTLNRQDDFALSFDLDLDNVAVGVDPAKPFTFEIALGLIQLASATNAAFWRGAGVNDVHGPRNLVEFAYFPDSGFGATVSPSVISTDNEFASQFDLPIELGTGSTFNIYLRYTAGDQTMRTWLGRNHSDYASIHDVKVPAENADFAVDTVAICSYSDAGQDPDYGGSILADGWVDNLLVQLPPPPFGPLTGHRAAGAYEVTFTGKGGWTYTLERATGLREWAAIATQAATTPGSITITDASPPLHQSFYRVQARR